MNLLLIGCGNIGSALLHKWSKAEFLQRIMVIQPSLSAAAEYAANSKINFKPDINSIPADFTADMTVLAVKPQLLQQVLPELVKSRHCEVIVSLLAGVPTATFSSQLQGGKIVRIMPNIAIKTGKSVNLAFTVESTNNSVKEQIEKVFNLTGLLIWLEQERMLDQLTPITGSGLAYFFLLAEILVAETIKLGIEKQTAHELIQQVLIGGASLVENNNQFADLKNSVASKKGVTEVALQIMTPAIQTTIAEAMLAALNRIQELANENRC